MTATTYPDRPQVEPDHVTVEIYDKTWQLLGYLNAPAVLECTWRVNAASTATITVAAQSIKAGLLNQEGSRVRIIARGLVWSGWMEHWELDGIGPDAVMTAVYCSDLTWLERMLCWPATGTLPGTLSKEYDRRSGPAETVFKGYLQAAITRLGLPITVAADQGRGSSIRAELRMHTPADKLLPLLDQAGLRAILVHDGGTGLTLDVAEIRTYPRTLTSASGVLGHDTKVSEDGPTASRVVVGGAGDGTARLFRRTVFDNVETVHGRIFEKFLDARDLQVDLEDPQMDTQAEVDAAMDARAVDALWEADSRLAVTATLSETAWFRVAAGVLEPGDRVPLDITVPTADPARPLSVQVTETITEATLTWDTENGMTITPKLGRMVDNPQGPLLTRVAALSRQMRAIAANK